MWVYTASIPIIYQLHQKINLLHINLKKFGIESNLFVLFWKNGWNKMFTFHTFLIEQDSQTLILLGKM